MLDYKQKKATLRFLGYYPKRHRDYWRIMSPGHQVVAVGATEVSAWDVAIENYIELVR